MREVLLLGQKKIEEQKVKTYWETGKIIQTHLLAHQDRADYGKQVIFKLARDLEVSDSVLRRTVQFYHAYPISAGPRKLTWAHYCELLPIKNKEARSEIEHRTLQNEWTSEDLRRKMREEFREGIRKSAGLLDRQAGVLEDRAPSDKTVSDLPPLKAKPGKLYTYPLIQPDQTNEGRPYLFIDLGFAACRRFYPSARESGFKAGDIVESQWMKGDLYKLSASSAGQDALYTYKAIVERVVDGDTLRVKVDLGFDTWTRQYLRLRGLDCPEQVTEEGKKAKRFVEKKLEKTPFILLKSTRSDKYDRYLADVWIPGSPQLNSVIPAQAGIQHDALYLNQLLIDEGHALRVRE